LIFVKYQGSIKIKYNEYFNKINNKKKLKQRSEKFTIIGNVRGQGLFLGIELVDQELHPFAEKTDYVVNRMKEFGILMPADGPNHIVIKIKPPLKFTKENADEVLLYLQRIVAEEVIKKG
jgi:4-aminobutyrate aminotransferase-like enzyme